MTLICPQGTNHYSILIEQADYFDFKLAFNIKNSIEIYELCMIYFVDNYMGPKRGMVVNDKG